MGCTAMIQHLFDRRYISNNWFCIIQNWISARRRRPVNNFLVNLLYYKYTREGKSAHNAPFSGTVIIYTALITSQRFSSLRVRTLIRANALVPDTAWIRWPRNWAEYIHGNSSGNAPVCPVFSTVYKARLSFNPPESNPILPHNHLLKYLKLSNQIFSQLCLLKFLRIIKLTRLTLLCLKWDFADILQ